MGRSLSADLQYGYFLGADGDTWELEDIDEENYDSYPEIEGFDPEEDSFTEFLNDRLEDNPVAGVKLDFVGYDGGCNLLVCSGSPSVYCLDVIDLPTGPPDGADEALTKALEILGIRPKGEPGWILSATYF